MTATAVSYINFITYNIAYATFKFVAVSLYLSRVCFIRFCMVSVPVPVPVVCLLSTILSQLLSISVALGKNSIAYIALLLCPLIIIVNSLQSLFIYIVSVSLYTALLPVMFYFISSFFSISLSSLLSLTWVNRTF